jgi:hypothetical protein
MTIASPISSPQIQPNKWVTPGPGFISFYKNMDRMLSSLAQALNKTNAALLENAYNIFNVYGHSRTQITVTRSMVQKTKSARLLNIYDSLAKSGDVTYSELFSASVVSVRFATMSTMMSQTTGVHYGDLRFAMTWSIRLNGGANAFYNKQVRAINIKQAPYSSLKYRNNATQATAWLQSSTLPSFAANILTEGRRVRSGIYADLYYQMSLNAANSSPLLLLPDITASTSKELIDKGTLWANAMLGNAQILYSRYEVGRRQLNRLVATRDNRDHPDLAMLIGGPSNRGVKWHFEQQENSLIDFFDKTHSKLWSIRDQYYALRAREDLNRILQIVTAVISGLAMLGSVGFMWGNGFATFVTQYGSIGPSLVDRAVKGNLLPFFGSFTLFLNNGFVTGLTSYRTAIQNEAIIKYAGALPASTIGNKAELMFGIVGNIARAAKAIAYESAIIADESQFHIVETAPHLKYGDLPSHYVGTFAEEATGYPLTFWKWAGTAGADPSTGVTLFQWTRFGVPASNFVLPPDAPKLSALAASEPKTTGHISAVPLAALEAYDTDLNGTIDPSDLDWGAFGQWTDADKDGVYDAGEFKTLDELGISLIQLKRSQGSMTASGQDPMSGAPIVQSLDGRPAPGKTFPLALRDSATNTLTIFSNAA